MLIDGFTVGAQALNFLILVWLMKRFLYHPILKAIDEREQRIAKQIADAQALQAQAEQQLELFRQKNLSLDEQSATLLNQARQAAQTEKQVLLEAARQEADALRNKHLAALKQDALQLNQALSLKIRQEVFAISRKVLSDLGDVSLEQCIAAVFIQRLQALSSTQQGLFAQAVQTTQEPALLRSGFNLTDEYRSTLQNALNLCFSADIPLRFETDVDLIGGIEFIVHGQKLAWTIADYLSGLENQLADFLAADEVLSPQVPAKPVEVASQHP